MTCAQLSVGAPTNPIASDETVQPGNPLNVRLTHTGIETIAVTLRLFGRPPVAGAGEEPVGPNKSTSLPGAVTKTVTLQLASVLGLALGREICLRAKGPCSPNGQSVGLVDNFFVGP